MSVSELQNRVSTGTQLTTTGATTCYTASVKIVQLAGIRATNKAATNQTLLINWTDASAALTYRLYGSASVQAGSAVYMPFDDFMVLREGDTISAQADLANAFDVVVTVIESPGALY